jgi:hypothetical protein
MWIHCTVGLFSGWNYLYILCRMIFLAPAPKGGAMVLGSVTSVTSVLTYVRTSHFVSGAYLENRSTDFNHITHTWSPHTIDVPVGMHDLLEGQRRSNEGCNLSCRFRSISQKPLNGCQPNYAYMIPASMCLLGVYDPLNVKRRCKEGWRRL